MISNDDVASLLEEVASLLDAQGADGFRVRAYRQGADAVRAEARPVARILAEEGHEGLEAIPHIGRGLARSIDEIVRRGRLGMLDRLRGEISPEDLFTSLPGIGEVLAQRIHEELGVETLEELELAAHDGRLERVSGVGRRRAAALRDVLAARLGRKRGGTRPQERAGERPAVALLLAVDRAYREAAEQGKLRKIAPRRFNPTKEAWLPVMHVERDGWEFTALFSNTAQAHQLDRTHDWVVVYWSRDGHEGQNTIVTESGRGKARRRVVRGRENEKPTRAER